MASPNAGHAAWCEKIKAEARAKHGGLSQKEIKRRDALVRYYLRHDENKERQKLRAREKRRVCGEGGPLREPATVKETMKALSRFDTYGRRGTYMRRNFTELMAAHEEWLESIDLWRMAEELERNA